MVFKYGNVVQCFHLKNIKSKHMETLKKLLPVAAFFISAVAFGQKSTKANGSVRANVNTHQSGSVNRNEARVNGSINANEHANQNAQRNANENSVLNGTTVRTKDRVKGSKSDA